MHLNEVLKEFAPAMAAIEKTTVVETFFAQLMSLEGAISEVYSTQGRLEEYSRDQVEFSIRCSCGTDELLETEELKQYYRLKKANFSAMSFMYNQRVNDDLVDLAWEAFQIATPQADRAMFDRVRAGDGEALKALQELHKAQ